ncbi:hypothetical protein F4677DRAFT_402154 [Hypoxylon crocopeplum]|nr:hypothetical protein F4677DRAFT_402154 [Hypoxylon crocopeplum]
MIRLIPTTISLTLTEVKEFERHLRFKKYLAREDALDQLPLRTKKESSNTQKTDESAQSNVNQLATGVSPKDLSIADGKESPRLLACSPQWPLKSGDDSTKSNSQPMPNSSQSGTSSSSNIPPPTGWGNLPMTLPPPFSRDKRSVSDAQSLPSSRRGAHRQPRPGEAYQEAPETPHRRSSLRDEQADIHSSSLSRRGRRRLVSSAVRFVGSMVRSPSRSTPSPSPRATRSESGSPARQVELGRTAGVELGFRVYDDALPALSQPQTPQNLPEARHQSRLHGSYTAPLPRVASRSAYQSSTVRERRDSTGSPSGFETPGYRGLYGGLENSEDSTLFYEASRYQEGSLEVEEG